MSPSRCARRGSTPARSPRRARQLSAVRGGWKRPTLSTLGPVQTLEVYDPLVAEIEAVLEHRRALVAARTLGLHHVADQISKLPTEIRDQLTTGGKIESRLRRLDRIDPAIDTTPAGAYRLEWLQAFIEADRTTRREIRRLERRINSVLHIASVTQARQQPQAAAYLARKASEGKTRREARRAHKRHLANRVIRRMWRDEQTRKQPHTLAA